MQSDDAQRVLLIPGDLGSVEDYFDPTAPPPKISSKGSLYTGGLYLRAALREMNQILLLCEDFQESHHGLLQATKAKYDYLDRWKRELQILEKRRSIFRPFELVAIRRAKREFRESARGLWNSTLTTSDTLRRALLSLPTVDVAPVESESLGRDERIGGLLTELPRPGEMSASDTEVALAAAQRVASILASSTNIGHLTHSDSQDGQKSTGGLTPNPETSSSAQCSAPTSPGSPGSASTVSYLNLNFSYNVINNTDSITPGFTINNTSEGSGSTIQQHSSVHSPPS